MIIACYGHLAEVIGREKEFARGDEAATIGELRQMLGAAYPDHAKELTGPRVKTLVNEQFVSDDHPLDGVQMVEFLPPVSGG